MEKVNASNNDVSMLLNAVSNKEYMTKAEALLEEQLESVSQRGEDSHHKYSRYAVYRKIMVLGFLLQFLGIHRVGQNCGTLTTIIFYTSFVINFMEQSSYLLANSHKLVGEFLSFYGVLMFNMVFKKSCSWIPILNPLTPINAFRPVSSESISVLLWELKKRKGGCHMACMHF
jgi:hypothetical protein